VFTKARVKLTTYYLVIIMFVSLLFSILAYRGFVYEIWRGLRLQGNNLPTNVLENIKDEVAGDPAPFGIFYSPSRLGQIIDREIYEEARKRVITNLFYINLAVLVTAGLGGYILAGVTLKPIEEVLEEHKRFVSDASHELRTPLTSLKTEIEVSLRDKKMTAGDARKILKSNLEDVDKIQDLTSYLLTLSRYEKNGANNFESVNLVEVVEHVIKKSEKTANEKKIKITKDLQKVNIRGNPLALTELVQILIDNAIKYTNQEGAINVYTKKTTRSSKFIVTDSGIGISPLDLPHIFDRFYRADQSRNKNTISGFGLGLSIAKKIADLHSASIKVESKLGKGSTFTVSFS